MSGFGGQTQLKGGDLDDPLQLLKPAADGTKT